jgi:hypothetical protein
VGKRLLLVLRKGPTMRPALGGVKGGVDYCNGWVAAEMAVQDGAVGLVFF